MADVIVALEGQRCVVSRGVLDWRIQHDIIWEEAFPPVEIGPPNYATIPVPFLADAAPLSAVPDSYAVVQSNGDVLAWQGRKRCVQVKLELRFYSPVLGSFSTVAYVSIGLDSDPLNGSVEGFLAVHVQWEDRVPGNIPDLVHLRIGAKTWTLENSVDTSGQPFDRRIQIAVDFGMAAANGRWGAYWVGLVSDKLFEYPEYPTMGFPGHKIEWLSEGTGDNTIGGDPVDGYPPLGYLFPAGYIPDSPIVVQTGLGVHMVFGSPLNSSATLVARREQFSYSYGDGIDDPNVYHLPDGFLAWDEEGPDSWFIRPRGKSLHIYQNYFVGLEPSIGLGHLLTLSQGVLGLGTGVTLEGMRADVLRGGMGIIKESFVVLGGKRLTMTQGVPREAVFAALDGHRLTTGRGGVGLITGVTLKGKRVQLVRGAFAGLTMTGALEGLRATVGQGTPQPGVGTVLQKQTLTAARGAIAQGVGAPLAGKRARVRRGVVGSAQGVTLAGHSLLVAQGALGKAAAVRLAGQRCAVVQGATEQQVDGIVSLHGLRLQVRRGELPVKPIPPDKQLWATQQNSDLTIEKEPPG